MPAIRTCDKGTTISPYNSVLIPSSQPSPRSEFIQRNTTSLTTPYPTPATSKPILGSTDAHYSTMASYLQKLRRQSKQLIPQTEKKNVETSKVEDTPQVQVQEPQKAHEPETTTAGPSGPVPTAPVPTVAEPAEDTGVEPELDEEDQVFLARLSAIASEPEGEAPPLPTRPTEGGSTAGEQKLGRNAQEALMDGADKVALPMSPSEPSKEPSAKGKEKAKGPGLDRKKTVMSYFSPVVDRFKKSEKAKAPKDKTDQLSEQDKAKMADDLHAAAETAKAENQKKEDKELTDILDQLNLSAVNNRVFSFSKESEELLGKFTLVLKDIINGAPTAYNDLEKLFTDYDNQLKKMYGGLPPFLQNMVKSLPAKLTATLGPELLAASAEKPGFDAKTAGGSKTKSKRSLLPTVPSLKSLVTAQGAVATALRSIVNFLKFRFPMMATGTNLIMSLAVFREYLIYPTPNISHTDHIESSSLSSGTATSAAARPVSRKIVSPPLKPLNPVVSAAPRPSTKATTTQSLTRSLSANPPGPAQRLNSHLNSRLSPSLLTMGGTRRPWTTCPA
jgi:hypothetical protein